ncbi:hypothetical protein [Cyanobium sp. WAJ14-Wanaka]|uniref:hypothetical protein n=1 Tax=Cyanobium sp. WAJ14-Wanaka TaxID=2823725 RepID=UPI0020CCFCDB|nr:hypothetical protein [Cyanobium sp. WAJ14-Wanaka]MCP9775995.1 hypothetical protein [Cyanobium sp. WAJ14-Wanaka]
MVESPAESTKKSNGCAGCLSVVGILFLILVGVGLFQSSTQTPEQKLEEWYAEVSHVSCERILKERLKDPDSYRQISDFAVAKDTGTEKNVVWRFRAKNGFGGYGVSAAICKVSKKDGGSVNPSIVGE